MLRLRPAQVHALDAGVGQQRRRRAVEHLRAHFSEQIGDRSEQQLDRFVERSAAYARRHGLGTMADLLRVLNLAVVFGEKFIEHHDWMQERMDDDAFDHPSERLAYLHAEAIARLRPAP